jgi:hypothetical protein
MGTPIPMEERNSTAPEPTKGEVMKTILTVLALVLAVQAEQNNPQETPAEHHAAVMARGEHTMGFSQQKTTHHFLLFKDGGVIAVTTNDPRDAETRDMVRMHLSHIAHMFANGNFSAPMLIHATIPPGVPVMTELKSDIVYRYKDVESGGQVRIQTANPRAIEAIHGFLRFQIKDHETGDSGEIVSEAKP